MWIRVEGGTVSDDADKREEIVLQRVKRDGATGLVLDERYVVLKSMKKSIEELRDIAEKVVADEVKP